MKKFTLLLLLLTIHAQTDNEPEYVPLPIAIEKVLADDTPSLQSELEKVASILGNSATGLETIADAFPQTADELTTFISALPPWAQYPFQAYMSLIPSEITSTFAPILSTIPTPNALLKIIAEAMKAAASAVDSFAAVLPSNEFILQNLNSMLLTLSTFVSEAFPELPNPILIAQILYSYIPPDLLDSLIGMFVPEAQVFEAVALGFDAAAQGILAWASAFPTEEQVLDFTYQALPEDVRTLIPTGVVEGSAQALKGFTVNDQISMFASLLSGVAKTVRDLEGVFYPSSSFL